MLLHCSVWVVFPWFWHSESQTRALNQWSSYLQQRLLQDAAYRLMSQGIFLPISIFFLLIVRFVSTFALCWIKQKLFTALLPLVVALQKKRHHDLGQHIRKKCVQWAWTSFGRCEEAGGALAQNRLFWLDFPFSSLDSSYS